MTEAYHASPVRRETRAPRREALARRLWWAEGAGSPLRRALSDDPHHDKHLTLYGQKLASQHFQSS